MPRVRRLSAACLFCAALAGCGSVPEPRVPAPPALEDREPALQLPPAIGLVRTRVEAVPVPPSFLAAVERGTRTLEGRPGPRYWQQRVSYRIDAELDPASARLSGRETVVYLNQSPDTLPFLIFHLYQNAFAAGAPRTRRVPVTDGIRLASVSVEGTPARLGARQGAGYAIDGTLMSLRLPRPLPPGDSVRIELEWSFEVPEGAPRMGRRGRELFSIAQWYPQVAVYDDVDGWHAWPYLTSGEFYLEYGDFDVSITVPEGWLVGATGELQNPEEVLTETVRSRLGRALAADEVVRVVTEQDLGAGNATARAPGGQLTWRFAARNVRDFAFTTSDRYLWDATRASVPEPAGAGTRHVPVHALYLPRSETWREAARYTRHALEFHSRSWHPYIYPQMTSAEGPFGGGMEYPMITFNATGGGPERLYMLLNHETAHQWWPMMVGSNEPRHAWQDEGLSTFVENLATADFLPDMSERVAFESDRQRYLSVAGTEFEKEIMRHADLYGPGGASGPASYSKPAVLMRALAEILGPETLRTALRQYAADWLLRHPSATDFFAAVERAASRDLDWFWHAWWYETAVLDQALARVELTPTGRGERATITIVDEGGAPMPIRLVLRLEGGGERRLEIPVDVWLDGARTHRETIELPGRLASVVIDPELAFPDVDLQDNVWERPLAPRD